MPDAIYFIGPDGVRYRVLDIRMRDHKTYYANPPAAWATARVFRPAEGWWRHYTFTVDESRSPPGAPASRYKMPVNAPTLPPMIAPCSVCPLMLPIPAPMAVPATVLTHAARASMPHVTIRVMRLRVMGPPYLAVIGFLGASEG
jgi:hypothetical protein